MLMVINVVRQLEPQGRRRCARLQLHLAIRREAVDVFGTGNGAECLRPVRVHAVEGAGLLQSMKRAGLPGAFAALEVGARGGRVGAGLAGVAAGVGRVDGPAGTVIVDRRVTLDGGLHGADRAAATVVGLLLHHATRARGEDDLIAATGSARGRGSTRSAGGVGRAVVGALTSARQPQDQGCESEKPVHHDRPPFSPKWGFVTIFTLPVLFAFVKRNFPQLFWYLAKIGLF